MDLRYLDQDRVTDFNLISEAERDAVVDAIRSRRTTGQLTTSEADDLTARARTAQTHAGLDSVLLALPPEAEQPPRPRPRRSAGGRRWTIRRPRFSVPKLSSISPQVWLLAVPVAFVLLAVGLKRFAPDVDDEPQPETPATSIRPSTTTIVPSAPRAGEVLPNGDILWLVGRDIQPGRYIAPGPDVCSWQRTRVLGGAPSEVIQAYRKSGPRHIVDVVPGDGAFVASAGCGEWRPYEPLATPLAEFGDGDWLVGADVDPGRYRAPGTTDGGICVWSRGADFSREEVLQHDIGADATEATLDEGDRFSTRGCGTWTKD